MESDVGEADTAPGNEIRNRNDSREPAKDICASGRDDHVSQEPEDTGGDDSEIWHAFFGASKEDAGRLA